MKVIKKITVEQIHLDLAPHEVKILERYCNKTGKLQTFVIQELIRSLPD